MDRESLPDTYSLEFMKKKLNKYIKGWQISLFVAMQCDEFLMEKDIDLLKKKAMNNAMSIRKYLSYVLKKSLKDKNNDK